MRARLAAVLLSAVALAGCAMPGAPVEAPTPGATVTLALVEDALAAAAGGRVAFGVVVENAGVMGVPLRVRAVEAPGLVSAADARFRLTSGSSAAGMVTVALTGDAPPGVRKVAVVAEDGDGARLAEATLALTVLPAADGAREGDALTLRYVGRFTDGTLFGTNIPAYTDAPFARAIFFSAAQGEIPVALGSDSKAVPGLWKGLLSAQAGEARSFTIGPEDAYPARSDETRERVTRVPRATVLPVSEETVPLEQLEEVAAAEGRDAASYRAGEHFTVERAGNAWRYLVTGSGNGTVSFRLDPEPGTVVRAPGLPPTWANATVVARANGTEILLETTPPAGLVEPFTFHAHWPEASRIVATDGEAILVEHTPPLGLEYEEPARPGQAARGARVEAVDEDAIRVSVANPSPLAGKTLVFDVRVVTVTPG